MGGVCDVQLSTVCSYQCRQWGVCYNKAQKAFTMQLITSQDNTTTKCKIINNWGPKMSAGNSCGKKNKFLHIQKRRDKVIKPTLGMTAGKTDQTKI